MTEIADQVVEYANDEEHGFLALILLYDKGDFGCIVR